MTTQPERPPEHTNDSPSGYPESDARRVVEAYFGCMRAGDLGVADLFHEDAVLLGLGRRTQGREAIRNFYRESISSGRPQPRLQGPLLVHPVSDKRTRAERVAAEILIALADGTQMHVVDLFEVDGGMIRSLTYFVADEPAA